MKKDKGSSYWQQTKSELVYGSTYFSIHRDQCLLPDGRTMPRYYVVDFPDWVQVVALNEKQELILVHQYRYPGDGWFIEFPGGSTHPDRQEDPRLAAERELLEETGYQSQNWIYIGAHYPNPALMRNRCHVYLAKDCRQVAAQNLDPYEEIETILLSRQALEKEIKDSGKIHSLMLATYEMVKSHL